MKKIIVLLAAAIISVSLFAQLPQKKNNQAVIPGAATAGATCTTPYIYQPPDQTVCNNSATTTVNFTGSVPGTVYTWINNTPSIGLAASGTGDISSFTATNTTNEPVTATITVTPVAGAYFAYISNGASVSVINSVTNAVVATIPVGDIPYGVSVSPDGSRVYVTNWAGYVSVINTATNTVVATIPVGNSPEGIAVSPDGNRVYVANMGSNNVSVINTATNTVSATFSAGTAPSGVAISPDGSRVYVTNHASGNIAVINSATNTVITTIPAGTPRGITVSPDGSRLYVANEFSDNVSVINAATNTVIADIHVGGWPVGVSISPDGSKVYIANSYGGVSVINALTNAVVTTVNVGSAGSSPGAFGLSVTPDGSRVYVGVQFSNSVVVINTATNTVATAINVGASPNAIGNFITGGPVCTGSPKTFTITVSPASGKTIPGRIEAESWDAKSGPQYAIPSTDVCGDQQVVGITNGSWMDYNVTVVATGMYKVGFRVATMQNNMQFQVKSMPSGNVLGTINILNTGNWTNWQTQLVSFTLPLLAGQQTIRIQSSGNESCNFNWIDWTTACTTPDVNQLPDQTVCNNAATAAKNFTGSVPGTVYKWTNSNPSIGLAASGLGDIPSFIATNTTNAPVTATITVTPSSGGSYAYIPNLYGGNVSVINTATNSVVATIPIGSFTSGVAVSPDGSRVYVTYWPNAISVINTVTNSVIANITVGNSPSGMSVSPDGNRLYVANGGSDNISVINTLTNSVVATFSAGISPSGVSISPDGSRLYVANSGSGNISVINTVTNAVVATVPVGSDPSGVLTSPDGSRLYVANYGSGTVTVINTATNSVVATAPAGLYPVGISITPDGSRLYVTNNIYNPGTVSVINTTTNSVAATVNVGSAPRGISITPDGSRVYVANSGSDNVSVINTATNTVLTNVIVSTLPVAFGNFITSGPVCTGASKTFTITVKPTPDVNQPINQTVCNNTATTAVNFTGSVAGNRFTWTNSNPSIGLTASGTGDIPSFTATNTTNAPVTATITVTPAEGAYFAYIPRYGAGDVSVVNTVTNTIVATIPVSPGPWGVSVSPDGSRAYISLASNKKLAVINTATNTVVANIQMDVYQSPGGVSVSPDGSRVYVATKSNLTVINTATNSASFIGIGGDVHYDVSVSPDGSRVYVTNRESNDVSVINAATLTTVAIIPVGARPHGVSVSPDGSRVYVCNNSSGTVSVINTATNTVITDIPVGAGPWGVTVTPDGSRAYVANNGAGTVSVINTTTNSVVATIPVANGAAGISVTPDGSRVYLGYGDVINTATNTVVATIPVGGGAAGFSNFITGNICTGASKTFTITVNPTCNKFIPGRIEAESWDVKNGPQYAIASTDAGGGQQVVGITNGSWMDYNVTVLTTGLYKVDFRVATTQSNAQFQVKLGATVLGTINIPNTGGWSNWQTVTLNNISLTAGVQTIRIQSISNESCNFNWTDWSLQSACNTVQAESFIAKNGVQYAVPTNDPAGGVQHVTGFINGGWLDYNVPSLTTGTYTVNFRVATPQNSVQLQIYSGGILKGTKTITNTGNWNNWQTQSLSGIALTAGQPLRIQVVSNGTEGCNFNWFELCSAAIPSATVVNTQAVNKTPVLDEITGNKLAASVFPNPASSYFNLKIQTKSTEQVTVRVIDIAGRQVQQLNGNPAQTLRFGNKMVNGTYFVEVRQGTEKVVLKVLKQ